MAAQSGQAEAFGNDALAGKGRIAVQQQRQHLGAIDLGGLDPAAVHGRELVLLGARLAEHHRIDDLEVRGVGGQRQVDLVAVELAVRGRAEVILDVARAFHVVGGERPALELVEDRAQRLAHDLGQHVEAAAVGHAEDDLLHAERAAALDDLLQRGQQGLAAVETEALRARVLDVEELLEALGLDQLVEDRLLALGRELDLLVRTLDALLDPRLLRRIGDVHELDAERRAIGALEDVEHLAQRRELEAQHVVDEDLAVPVGLGEAVGRGMQLLVIDLLLEVQGIEVRMQVTAHAVGADHHQRANRVARLLLDVGIGQGRALLLCLGLQLVADCLLHRRPVAVEGIDQIAVRGNRPVGTLPGCAARLLEDVRLFVSQIGEEVAPRLVERAGVFLVARVEIFDIRCVAAVKKRRHREGIVRVLPSHHYSEVAPARLLRGALSRSAPFKRMWDEAARCVSRAAPVQSGTRETSLREAPAFHMWMRTR